MGWLTAIGGLALLLAVGQAKAQRQPLVFDSTLRAVRFAEGDVDGDGRLELVLGGRVGPFRALTEPAAANNGQVEICALGAGGLQMLSRLAGLEVVHDLGVGDLDGNGVDEIVAVGPFRLYVLAYERGRLELGYGEDMGQLLRVDCADMDGDGRAEIAIAQSRTDPGAEVRSTDIRLFRFAGGLELVAELSLETHVGDLCLADLDGDGSAELILEQGAEEIGGLIRGYRMDGATLNLLFAQQVGDGRGLNLAACPVGDTALVAVGGVGGQVQLLRLEGPDVRGLQALRPLEGSGRSSGIHLTRIFDLAGIQLLGATSGPGDAFGQFWRVDGLRF